MNTFHNHNQPTFPSRASGRATLLVCLAFSFAALVTRADPPAVAPATVHVYRPWKAVGAMLSASVFCDDELIVELSNSRSFTFELSPGKHVLRSTVGRLELDVRSEATYLVSAAVVWGGGAQLTLMQPEEGTKAYAKTKPVGADRVVARPALLERLKSSEPDRASAAAAAQKPVSERSAQVQASAVSAPPVETGAQGLGQTATPAVGSPYSAAATPDKKEAAAPTAEPVVSVTGDGTQVKEEFLGSVPAVGGFLLTACIPYQGGNKVLYGIGESSPPTEGNVVNLVLEDGQHFDSVMTGSPVLSAARRHLALAIGHANGRIRQWDILFDGKILEYKADSISHLAFSPDGRRLAFTVRYGKQYRVEIAGEPEGPPYEWAGAPSFSPDSAHFAYAAGESKKVFVVMDHKVVWSQEGACRSPLQARQAETPFPAFFSPDSKSWAMLMTGCKGTVAYNINGKLDSEEYGAVSPIEFSPDGLHSAFLGVHLKHGMLSAKGEGVIVVDGKPSETYEGPGIPSGSELRILISPGAYMFGASSPWYMPDGKLVYTTRTKAGFSLMLDGQANTSFEEIVTEPVLSSDGKRIGFLSLHNKELQMVVGGKASSLDPPVAADDFSFIEAIGFAPDNTLMSVLNKHGKLWTEGLAHARRRLLLNGRLGKEYDCMEIGLPIFSPNGKHYSYFVRGIKDKTVRTSDFSRRVIVDGFEGPEYSYIVFPRLMSGSASVYFAIRGAKLYRVTQQAPNAPGTGVSNSLSTPAPARASN